MHPQKAIAGNSFISCRLHQLNFKFIDGVFQLFQAVQLQNYNCVIQVGSSLTRPMPRTSTTTSRWWATGRRTGRSTGSSATPGAPTGARTGSSAWQGAATASASRWRGPAPGQHPRTPGQTLSSLRRSTRFVSC